MARMHGCISTKKSLSRLVGACNRPRLLSPSVLSSHNLSTMQSSWLSLVFAASSERFKDCMSWLHPFSPTHTCVFSFAAIRLFSCIWTLVDRFLGLLRELRPLLIKIMGAAWVFLKAFIGAARLFPEVFIKRGLTI